MKKTLKLVGIFMAVTIVVIAGGLSIYFLVQNNRTYYIYDLRIVEPIANANRYIYTDSEGTYTSIKNQTVYMTSDGANRFEIGIYAYTSINTTNVEISSSDTSVARVIISNNHCYVEYIGAGVATITVSIGDVTDSFNVYVYNDVANDFIVYDNRYYGEYSNYFPNQITSYSDAIEYTYDYVVSNSSMVDAGDVINSSLIRIDETKLNTEVFENVAIDAVNKKLVLTCKADLDSNVDETIVIQTYYYTVDGAIKVANNYYVNVHVVAYTPEFLQIELATTPDFTDGYVFMDTQQIDESSLTEDILQNNTEILENFLSYQKAESNLVSLNERSVYNTYFTEKVTTIYLRFRKVYTNGDIVYLTPDDEDNPYNITADNNNLKISANRTYYVLTVPNSYYNSNTTFDITVSISDFDLSHTFEFEFADLDQENLEKFYDYNEETQIYTYTYWDPRTRYSNEVYDELGNVIGFIGINVN